MLLFFERVELIELEDFGGRVGRGEGGGGGGWPIIQTLLTIEEEGGYTIYKYLYNSFLFVYIMSLVVVCFKQIFLYHGKLYFECLMMVTSGRVELI